MAARASGQNTAWLDDGVHWSASPVVPWPQTTIRFFLLVLGVRTRPVAVIVAPVTDVVTYEMRLPVDSGANSAGRVAVVLVSTVPASTAALAGDPAKRTVLKQRRTTWQAAIQKIPRGRRRAWCIDISIRSAFP